MGQMLTPLLRNEIAKTFRTKLPYMGFCAVWLVCVLIFLFTESLRLSDTVNGWTFIGFAMQSSFAEVGLIFLTLFSSLLIADETGQGTLRMVLSSPLRRSEFFVAKVITGLCYMVLLYGGALLISVVLAAFRFPMADIKDVDGIVYTRREVITNLAAAFSLSWLPASAAVLFGICISAIARRGSQAIGASIGILILVETVKHLLHISPWVFTSFMSSPWAIFHEMAQGVSYTWLPDIWSIILVPAASGIVFLVIGWWVFLRRDFNG